MASLILRGLDRERYPIVKAFAALPPEAWDFVCSQVMQFGRTAGGFETESRQGLELLAARAEALFEARKKPSP